MFAGFTLQTESRPCEATCASAVVKVRSKLTTSRHGRRPRTLPTLLGRSPPQDRLTNSKAAARLLHLVLFIFISSSLSMCYCSHRTQLLLLPLCVCTACMQLASWPHQPDSTAHTHSRVILNARHSSLELKKRIHARHRALGPPRLAPLASVRTLPQLLAALILRIGAGAAPPCSISISCILGSSYGFVHWSRSVWRFTSVCPPRRPHLQNCHTTNTHTALVKSLHDIIVDINDRGR
jgi:hypothetical protein